MTAWSRHARLADHNLDAALALLRRIADADTQADTTDLVVCDAAIDARARAIAEARALLAEVPRG